MSPTRSTANPGLQFPQDTNEAIEDGIRLGLSTIPVIGGFLSTLIQCLWPWGSSNTDVWDSIKAQVEQLIDQKLEQQTYNAAILRLQALNTNMHDYLDAVQNSQGNPTVITSTWETTNGLFDNDVVIFQVDPDQALLSPLFAQFANLHLTLLRDGVLHGKSWGWTDEYVASIAKKLTRTINTYSLYAIECYSAAMNVPWDKNMPPNAEIVQPLRAILEFDRAMVPALLNYHIAWPYFDVTKFPPPLDFVPQAEIYSDPYGAFDPAMATDDGAWLRWAPSWRYQGNQVGQPLWPSVPTKPLSQIEIWANFAIDGVRLSYPTNSGPHGMTTIDVGRNDDGVSGKTVVIDLGNPITAVSIAVQEHYVAAVDFNFKDGTSTGWIGKPEGGGSPQTISFPGRVLSSIWFADRTTEFKGVGMVFGFQYEQTLQPLTETHGRQ